jgi:hypothetical protein
MDDGKVHAGIGMGFFLCARQGAPTWRKRTGWCVPVLAALKKSIPGKGSHDPDE